MSLLMKATISGTHGIIRSKCSLRRWKYLLSSLSSLIRYAPELALIWKLFLADLRGRFSFEMKRKKNMFLFFLIIGKQHTEINKKNRVRYCYLAKSANITTGKRQPKTHFLLQIDRHQKSMQNFLINRQQEFSMIVNRIINDGALYL
jgi:hypothetical protein